MTEAVPWPASWNKKRQKKFAARMTVFQVLPEMLPALAEELEKVSAAIGFVIDEDLLEDYLRECAKIAARVGQIRAKQANTLHWASVILDKIAIHRQDRLLASLLKIMCLLVVFLLLIPVAGPIRLFYIVRLWWAKLKFKPTFKKWLDCRIRPTLLSLSEGKIKRSGVNELPTGPKPDNPPPAQAPK